MDQAAARTASDPAASRSRRGAAAALGAMGLGALVLFAGAWVVRFQAADALLRSTLAERGVRGQWRITRLDPTGARLEQVRIGPLGRPDFEARAVELSFDWGFGPRLGGVAIEGGRLRARWTQTGLDLGDLARLTAPGPTAARRPMPLMALSTAGLVATLDTPIGPLSASMTASGRLTRDFRADVTLLTTQATGPSGSLSGLTGALVFRTEPKALVAKLEAGAALIRGPWGEAAGLRVTGAGAVDPTLADGKVDLTFDLDRLASAGMSASRGSVSVAAKARGLESARAPDQWRVEVRNGIERILVPGLAGRGVSGSVAITGVGPAATGQWQLAGGAETSGLDLPIQAQGSMRLRGGSWSGGGALTVRGGKAVETARLLQPLEAVAATPIAPLVRAARPALQRALAAFDADAPLAFAWADGAGAIRGSGPVAIRAASGAHLDLAPPADSPPWQLTLPGARLSAAGDLQLQGGEAPTLRLRRFALDGTDGGFDVAGHVEIPRWRAVDAALQTDDLDFVWRSGDGGGRLTLAGDVGFSGPLAGVQFIDAAAPLDLDVETRGRAWTVRPRSGCLALRAGGLGAIGVKFSDARFDICPAADGAFAAASPAGALSGGVVVSDLKLAGRTEGARSTPAGLSLARAAIRLGGVAASPTIAATVQTATFTQTFSPERTLSAGAAKLDLTGAAADSWALRGLVSGATVKDPGLPFALADGRGDIAIRPTSGGAVLRIANASAIATDDKSKPPQKLLFNPMRIAEGAVEIADGKAVGSAVVRLAETGAPLGRLDIEHDLAGGAGEARFAADDLVFSGLLQPYNISEIARGLVDNVEGPVDATVRARWTPDAAHVDAALSFKNIAAATAGLGPMKGITGTVTFDDFAALTTPPHQEIRVAEINPGVPISDGLVRFQLRPGGIVALEAARFPFARGTLSVTPTFVRIGAEETRYTVELSGIDVAQFIEDLNFKDLQATGKVEGVFPVVVTPRGARIENGLLNAAPGGGTIAYTGAAAKEAKGGPSQVAFDALRNFRYDDLALELNGDLDGEIVTGIRFRGVNNLPVTTATLIPGMKTVGATGLPFRFNVTVRAPFRKLAEGAKRFASPLNQLEQTQGLDPAKVP